MRLANARRRDFDELGASTKLLDARASGVAHARPHAAHQLLDDAERAALVGHAALHPFGHQLVDVHLGFLEIAVGGALLHRAERPHAAVGLVGAPLEQLDLSRRFLGAGEQRPEHDRMRPGAERLGDVARVAYAAIRSSGPSPTPTAAPTGSLPCASLRALGCSLSFRMSLTVTRPIRWNSSSITSTRSSRWRCMSALASSRLAPSRTVTSFLCGVMMDFTGWSSSASKRRSGLRTIPTTLPPFTTGKPEILYCRCTAITSRTVISGEMVIGSRSTPDSKRLTLATSTACAWGVRFLWMMPMPPSWAMAMARRASVTVSMAADTRGMFSSSLRVRRVFRETSRGRTREWAGRRRTSSKVSAFWITRM